MAEYTVQQRDTIVVATFTQPHKAPCIQKKRMPKQYATQKVIKLNLLLYSYSRMVVSLPIYFPLQNLHSS